MQNIYYFLGIIILSLAMACNTKAKTTNNFEQELQTALRSIYLSHYGLEFPTYIENVGRCYTNR